MRNIYFSQQCAFGIQSRPGHRSFLFARMHMFKANFFSVSSLLGNNTINETIDDTKQIFIFFSDNPLVLFTTHELFPIKSGKNEKYLLPLIPVILSLSLYSNCTKSIFLLGYLLSRVTTIDALCLPNLINVLRFHFGSVMSPIYYWSSIFTFPTTG